MLSLLSWYLLITFLGWLTFPLAYRLFPALTDRGYTLSRTFGLLICGYIFWLFASFGIDQNDICGLMLLLVLLGSLSAWVIVNRKTKIGIWFSENRKFILTVELLYLITIALMA